MERNGKPPMPPVFSADTTPVYVPPNRASLSKSTTFFGTPLIDLQPCIHTITTSSKTATRSSEASAGSFTIQSLTINEGEDICEAINTYCRENGCLATILSASGSVINPTLLEIPKPGERIIHEGHFDIVLMKGSVGWPEDGGLRGFFVGPDGLVFGGEVTAPLISAERIGVSQNFQ
ncbi:AT-hook motif nuclear-localized protein 6-like [Wolffia australiana]